MRPVRARYARPVTREFCGQLGVAGHERRIVHERAG